MKQRRIPAPEMPLASLHVQPAAEQPAESASEVHGATVRQIATVLPPAPPAASAALAIVMIPLSKLKIHPFNSRVVRPQERIEEVRDMLTAENKQREPITVVPGRRKEDQGYFYILSGQTRFHSANLAGWTELEARINPDIDPDDHVAFWAASIEHNTSVRESDWDVAVQAKRLMEEGASQEQVMNAARRDARGLRRLLAMMDLPESVQAVVRDNPVKLTAPFCELLRSGIADLGEQAVAELAKRAVQEDLSHKALGAQIERDIKKSKKAGASGVKRATREFRMPITVSGQQKKAGELAVLQSRTNEGNRVINLSADLPEKYAEILKADIAASIAKFSADASDA